MKTFRVISVIFLISFLLPLIYFTGCEKDSDPAAPQLPPLNSFVMNFSDFQSSKKAESTALVDTSYWGYSAVVVAVWNLILTGVSAVPVASFSESFKHGAKYDGNNSWSWTYDVKVLTNTYTAKLKGSLLTDSVEWKMYVSKSGATGAFTDFLWYEGRSEYALSGGWWTLYESPLNPNELLQIDWKRANDSTANIRYTYVKPGVATNGGYIDFGITTENGIYNAFYNLYNKELNNLTYIQWNRTTKEGRVKDPNFFKHDAWHCWNSNLINTVCP